MEFSQRILLCEQGGIVIWYLVNCTRQEEKEAVHLCRKHLSKSAAKEVFVLTYDRMRRYKGVWHTEKKLLFPSYIFCESENGTLLSGELCESRMEPFLDKLPGEGKSAEKSVRLICLNQEEEQFLRFLYGDNHHLKMSKGVIRQGIPKVTAGPLKGMEQRICRIDRHKRLARLTMPMEWYHDRSCKSHQSLQEQNLGFITAGLEIIEKSI